MLICHNINHTTQRLDGSYHHLEVPHLKVTPGVPLIIDGDDDDGKQILINILSGLTFAHGADIKLFSSSPFALSLAHRHQTIGYFGDKDNFKPLWSVRDNLDLFSGGALNEILCRNLFEFFELDYIHFIDKEYGTLDEEMQMVLRAIGCFIAEPRTYFLHLPFCVLPTHFHLVLCELLTQQQDNIVIISHQKGHFLPLEGDTYSLYEGKLWHQGMLVESDPAYLARQMSASPNIGQKNSNLNLENLVQQFPLPEHKEQMVAQHLDNFAPNDFALDNFALDNFALDNFALDNFAGGWQQPNQPDEQSNVFAKFLTPIDDVLPIKKPAREKDSAPSDLPETNDLPQSDSPNIVAENNDEISDQINDEPNDELIYPLNDDSNDDFSDKAKDVNMGDAILSVSGIQADRLAHETAEMMIDLQINEPIPQEEIKQQASEQESAQIVTEKAVAEEEIAEITPPKITEQEIIEQEIAEPEIDGITLTDLPEIELADDDAPPQETVTQETIPEKEEITETAPIDAELPQEIISQEVIETLLPEIIEEEIDETIPIETITEKPITEIEAQQPDEVPDEIILTEQIDVFQHNKHRKFAYQPLDDNDTDIYQPTPSHFNHEPFIPPHSDNPDIIAKFEQHLHHMPEIGSVFQRELGQHRSIANNDLQISDGDNIKTETENNPS